MIKTEVRNNSGGTAHRKFYSGCIAGQTAAQNKLAGSALLFALVISLLLLILISSLVAANHYYSLQYQYCVGLQRAKNNFESAVLLGLYSSGDKKNGVIDLYGNGNDSAALSTWDYGLFGGFAAAVRYRDVRMEGRALTGMELNETGVFYLPGHGRPVKMSGNTVLHGRIFFPKEGYEPGYLSGASLAGNPMQGSLQPSESYLPALSAALKKKVETLLAAKETQDSLLPFGTCLGRDTIRNSFSARTLMLFSGANLTLHNQVFEGNIIIRCSGKMLVKRSAVLENVILCARCIEFEEESSCRVQAFASDTLITGGKCTFSYPSALVLQQKERRAAFLSLGRENSIDGIVLGIRHPENLHEPLLLVMGENSRFSGQLFFEGPASLSGELNGAIYINKTFVHTSISVNDNYMYNVIVNGNKLPPRFCGVRLLEKDAVSAARHPGILKWIF